MNRIERKFKQLKDSNKKAFIAFITAGYPDLAITEKLVIEFAQSGVDIIELGVPFSDPLADGPVIQESSKAALEKNINLDDIFKLVTRIRKFTEVSICLMTYYNPIFCYGDRKFIEKAVSSGVDGVIVPDLTPEEAPLFIKTARQKDLDTIFFVAPTSTIERIKLISRVSTGFIYYVSLTGVTGARAHLPPDLSGQIKVIKQFTDKPVCVGFGVSSLEQVRNINKICEGVIVGSAIVNKIKDNINNPDLVKNVSEFVRKLKG